MPSEQIAPSFTTAEFKELGLFSAVACQTHSPLSQCCIWGLMVDCFDGCLWLQATVRKMWPLFGHPIIAISAGQFDWAWHGSPVCTSRCTSGASSAVFPLTRHLVALKFQVKRAWNRGQNSRLEVGFSFSSLSHTCFDLGGSSLPLVFLELRRGG